MRIRLFAAILCLFVSACTKPPTEYDRVMADRLDRMALSVMTVRGTVVDPQGKGVSNLRVTVSSPRHMQESRTANDGYFSVEAKFSPNDQLDFHFTGDKVDWTTSLVSVPRGVAMIHARFLLENSGRIRLAGVEY